MSNTTAGSEHLQGFTDATFQKEVKEQQGLVLVDYWAPWCHPCLMLAPTIESLSKKYAGKIKFGKLNTDENMKTASEFGIMSIPTIILFKDGKEIKRISGAMPENFWISWLDEELNKPSA